MASLFMSDSYRPVHVSTSDVKIVSVVWGWQLGFTLLTCAKAGTQTIKIWRRRRSVTLYVAMIWLEIIVNAAMGMMSWMFMNGKIEPSFAYFFCLVTLWCAELQLLIQIIVNRLCLLVISKRRQLWLKWGSFAFIGVLNIGVYCIWIPAQLQVSQKYIDANQIYDRLEKILYLFLDSSLNLYFCYLVKSRLVDPGMTKYWPLFRFNIIIVFVSLAMDILLIGLLSVRNKLLYVQFHPVVFMTKLNIEMSMAHIISKIAKSHGLGYGYNDGQHSGQAKADMDDVPQNGHREHLSQPYGRRDNLTVINQAPYSTHSGWRKDTADPTASDLYHVWISGGLPSTSHNSQGHNRGSLKYGKNHDPGISFADGIRKDTTVRVTSEDRHDETQSRDHE